MWAYMYVLIGMNVFGSFSLWEPTCMCCVASGAVNTHIFVWKCLCATLNFHSFIHNDRWYARIPNAA